MKGTYDNKGLGVAAPMSLDLLCGSGVTNIAWLLVGPFGIVGVAMTGVVSKEPAAV